MDWWEKFEKLIEILGKDTVLQEVTNYFTSDQIDEFCNELIVNFDLDSEFNGE